MNRIRILAGLVVVSTAQVTLAQQVFVYPQKGQTQQQQDIDTAECRRWATAQSGVDPNAPAAQPNTGKRARGTVGGAAKGAAMGAAIGAIAGDAGKGAAIGAATGGVAGHRGARREEAYDKAVAKDDFARAFGACMEGRGYTVK